MKQAAGENVVVVIGDAFEDVDNWQGFFPNPKEQQSDVGLCVPDIDWFLPLALNRLPV